MSWKKLKISDCAVINPSSINPMKLPYKCINYYDISSVGSGILGEIARINVTDAPSRARRQIESGDTILAMVRPGNKAYYYFKTCNSQDIASTGYAVLRPKRGIVDPRFLYYAVTSDAFISYLVQHEKGATYPAVDENIILNGIIDAPDIETQHKISCILSSFDDLIENNQKQIKLLEEAAQRLFREWFVDLRFPGYEDTPIVNGIPKGWAVRPIGDFGDIITGKTPSTSKKEYYGGTIPFVKIPDMHDCVYPIKTESTLTDAGAKTQIGKFIPRNSIMVSCIATVGLVNLAVEKCQTNQQINSIVPADEKDVYFLYSAMKRIKELLEGVGSNGATMTNVNKTKFANLPVLYPTEELRNLYYDFCNPVFAKIYCLSRNIVNLINARNRLLPKLMSGEIEV